MRDGADETQALVRRALAAGTDFAHEAWRDAGGVLALSTLAGATVFFADHADISRALAHTLRIAGWLGLGLVFAPKLGALYRAALGGGALRELGPGGLQWTRVEWRLLGTAVSLAAFSLLAFSPLLALGVGLLALLRPLGAVSLGPLGTLGVGFLLLSPFLAAGAALIFGGLARLGLTLPAEAAEAQPRFARGWFVSRGRGAAAAAVAALSFLLPTLALLGLQATLEWLQAGAGDAFASAHAWPVVDAVVAGTVTAALASFVAAPFCVGAFAALYQSLTPQPVAVVVDLGLQARSEAALLAVGSAEATAALKPMDAPAVVARSTEAPGATPDGPEVFERLQPSPPRRPRHLRLVHSVDAIDPHPEPLAPKGAAREAEAALAAEPQEPFGP